MSSQDLPPDARRMLEQAIREATAGRNLPAVRTPAEPAVRPRSAVDRWHDGHHHPAVVKRPDPALMSAGAYNRAQVVYAARRTAHVAKRAHANRQRFGPFYIGATLAAGGEILHAIPGGVLPAIVFGALPAVFAGARQAWAAHRRGDDRAFRKAVPNLAELTWWQRAGWAARTAPLVWLPAAAEVGLTVPMRDSLGAGVLGGGIAWWIHLRRGDVVVEVEHVDEPEISEFVATWAELIGAPGGALPGSRLEDVTEDDVARRGRIELVRGKQSERSVMGALEAIRSAYDVEATQVFIERIKGRTAAVRFALYHRPPLMNTLAWAGPSALDPARGVAPFMTYDDGTTGPWRWWYPEDSGLSGVVHGFVVGTTGSGKSKTLGLKLAYERHSPLMVSWVGDPQRGQSLPRWRRAVDWYAEGLDEIRIMLHTARAVMLERSAEMADEQWEDEDGEIMIGRETFVPTPERPLLCITLDEAHMVLRDVDDRRLVPPDIERDMVELVDLVARMGRKCGVSLTLATHMPTLGDVQKMSLRSMLASGNVIILRTGERVSGDVIASVPLPANPYEIPSEIDDPDNPGETIGTGGMGYSLGGTGRAVIGRVINPGNQKQWANTGETTALDPAADRAALAYAGLAYADRRNPHRQRMILDNCPRSTRQAIEDEFLGDTGVELDDVVEMLSDTGVGPDAARWVPSEAPNATPDSPAERPPLHVVRDTPPSVRAAAVSVLRVLGESSTKTLIPHVRILVRDDSLADNTVTLALRRAAAAGEIEQLPGAAYGDDRSARWRVAAGDRAAASV